MTLQIITLPAPVPGIYVTEWQWTPSPGFLDKIISGLIARAHWERPCRACNAGVCTCQCANCEWTAAQADMNPQDETE